MFRENVLIALTLLITILALSFVILLTVYMQIHQMQERLKKIEAIEQEQMSSPPEPEITTPGLETLLKNIDAGRKSYEPVSPASSPGVHKPKLERQVQRTSTTTTTTTASTTTSTSTTENPDEEGFFVNSDYFFPFPQPPANARYIPFKMFNTKGHINVEVPDSINLNQEMAHMKKVFERLDSFYQMQNARNDEGNRKFSLNRQKPWFPPTKEQQSGFLWIRDSPAKPATPPPDHGKPFDGFGERINQMVRDGLSIFGKRKKRSLRKQESWNARKRLSGT